MLTDEQWADELVEAGDHFAAEGKRQFAKVHYLMAVDELTREESHATGFKIRERLVGKLLNAQARVERVLE